MLAVMFFERRQQVPELPGAFVRIFFAERSCEEKERARTVQLYQLISAS